MIYNGVNPFRGSSSIPPRDSQDQAEEGFQVAPPQPRISFETIHNEQKAKLREQLNRVLQGLETP